MKRFIVQALAALGFVLAVSYGLHAQVNRVTGPGVLDFGGAAKVDNDGELATYTATFNAVAPASAAGDLACLTGSSTKTIRLTRVMLSGTAGVFQTLPVSLMLRTTVSTSGTGTRVAAGKSLSTQSAATAWPTVYTANPTVNDAGSTLFTRPLSAPVTSATILPVVWESSWGGRGGARAPVLSGAAQQVCINLHGATVSAGVLAGSFEWTEE